MVQGSKTTCACRKFQLIHLPAYRRLKRVVCFNKTHRNTRDILLCMYNLFHFPCYVFNYNAEIYKHKIC